MKIQAIGDIHGRPDWKDLVGLSCDKIVFLGDYVDSYVYQDVDILHNLKEIIWFKEKHPEKVILLLGNHCLQYMFSYETHGCSGFRQNMYWDLHDLYTKNKDLFQVAYQEKNYLFTHAGIHKGWYDYSAIPQLIESGLSNEINIADQLNGLFRLNKSSLFDIGYLRGGFSQVGGIFWADKKMTSRKPLEGLHQIVGHTRVDDIKTITFNDNTSITYCDCLENDCKKSYIIEI